VPYWTLPNSIVLNPAHTIKRDGQSRLSSCIIRPTWYVPTTVGTYNIPAQSVGDTVQIMRRFTGTATSCHDKSCNMTDMMIIGFDTCDDTSNSQKTLLANLLEECLLDEWVHDNGGGVELQNVSIKQYIEGAFANELTKSTWDITAVQQVGTDGVKVTIHTGSGGSTPPPPALIGTGGDTVLIDKLDAGDTVAPAGVDGRWLTSSVTAVGTNSYDVNLIGASWSGPSVPSASWKAGSHALVVRDDTTNIAPGQYLCASGAAPFCTPPSGFSFFTATLSAAIPNGTFTGLVQVGGAGGPPVLIGWPVNGIAQIESEIVQYKVADGNHLNIQKRSLRNTSPVAHALNKIVTPAAPLVIGVAPTAKAAIVSTAARTTGSSAVTFANDSMIYVPTGSTLGTLTLNPAYHTWTSNTGAGGAPSSQLTTVAGTNTSAALTISKYCWKIQPGMKVADLDHPANLDSSTSVSSVDCSLSAGQVGLTPAVLTTFSADRLAFTGCGYPAAKPWLGNCTSTALLSGGDDSDSEDDEDAQGVVCDYFHSFGNQIQIHALDAPAMNCMNFVLAGGSVTGDQLDPDSIGVWLDGKTTKTQFTNGRLGGAVTSILDTPDADMQPDGIGISNTQVPGNIILGGSANVVFDALHGAPTATPFVYLPASVSQAHISGSFLAGWPIHFEDTDAFTALYCSGNAFATALCSQVKKAPQCSAGCSSVSGTDGDFDVLTDGTSTTVTIQLAGDYAAAPICNVSPGANGGSAVSASISLMDFEAWCTTVTFKTGGAVPHLYGSCRGPEV
jgi:hypothetical protein